jgi:hypothetical protein
MAKWFASQPAVKEGSVDQLSGHDRGRGPSAVPSRKRRTGQAIEKFFPVLSVRRFNRDRSLGRKTFVYDF